MFKKTFRTLLGLLTIIGLITGCGHSGKITGERTSAYSVDKIDLQTEIGRPQAAILSGTDIMMLCVNGENYGIYTFSRDSEHQYDVSPYATNMETSGSVLAFSVMDDGSVVLLTLEDGLLSMSRVLENSTPFDGSKVNPVDSENPQDLTFISAAITSTGKSYVVCLADNGIYWITGIDETGHVLFTVPCEDMVNGMALYDGTTPIVLLNGDTLKTMNSDFGNWIEQIKLDKAYTDLYSGNGVIYLGDTQGLSEFNYNTELTTELLRWNEVGAYRPEWILATDAGGFIKYGSEGLYALWPKTEDSVEKARKTITLATSSANLIASEILAFNETNEDYKIEVIAYTENDIDRLLTQINAGIVPDIFYFGTSLVGAQPLSSQKLAAAGCLADLYAFIDKDEELNRSSFLPNVLSAAAEGEHLYEMPYSFMIETVVGDATVVGDESGWSFDEMLEELEAQSFDGYLFGPQATREYVLEWMLCYNLSEYIDWSAGTCAFDTPEFQKLLEVVGRYAPPTYENNNDNELDLIKDGKQLLMREMIGRVNTLQLYDFYFENPVFIGFPTASGVGNSIVYEGSFSLSSTAQYADAAWSFIRQFYVPDYFAGKEEQLSFPVNLDALKRKYEYTASGFTLTYMNSNGDVSYAIHVEEPTKRNVQQVKELISSLTRVHRTDNNVLDIVWEEAQAYFAGTRSVEETTAIIQNRVQVYIAEQA